MTETKLAFRPHEHPEIAPLIEREDQLQADLEAAASTLRGYEADRDQADEAERQAHADALRTGKGKPSKETLDKIARARKTADDKIGPARREIAILQVALRDQAADVDQAIADHRPELEAAAEKRNADEQAAHEKRIEDGKDRLIAAVQELTAAREQLANEFGRPMVGLHFIEALRTAAGDAETWGVVLKALGDQALAMKSGEPVRRTRDQRTWNKQGHRIPGAMDQREMVERLTAPTPVMRPL